MRVVIETIPHKDQRYPTCGDWWWDNDTLHIRVSQLGDWRMEMLVARHEFDEALLCKAAGVSQAEVDAFDMGDGSDLDDPGESVRSPYWLQHMQAAAAEIIFATALGVDYRKYSDSIAKLVA